MPNEELSSLLRVVEEEHMNLRSFLSSLQWKYHFYPHEKGLLELLSDSLSPFPKRLKLLEALIHYEPYYKTMLKALFEDYKARAKNKNYDKRTKAREELIISHYLPIYKALDGNGTKIDEQNIKCGNFDDEKMLRYNKYLNKKVKSTKRKIEKFKFFHAKKLAVDAKKIQAERFKSFNQEYFKKDFMLWKQEDA